MGDLTALDHHPNPCFRVLGSFLSAEGWELGSPDGEDLIKTSPETVLKTYLASSFAAEISFLLTYHIAFSPPIDGV